MEVQRRREFEGSANAGSAWRRLWKVWNTRSLLVAAEASLQRMRRSGHILHYARPPEAMVRYFGSTLGQRDTDDPDAPPAGANFQRDRLILEAVRAERARVPRLEVWLLTGDANFAAQAAFEEFRVGLAWMPKSNDALTFSSPRIEPYGLTACHVPVEVFLGDLVGSVERAWLRPHGKANATRVAAPPARRDRVLLSMEPKPVFEGSEVDLERVPWPFTPASNDQELRHAPVRAPGTATLLNGLLDLQEGKAPAPKSLTYLASLGWCAESDGAGSPALTERGRQLAAALDRVTATDVDGMCSWLREAAEDVARLKPVAELLRKLKDRRGVTAAALSQDLGVARASVEATARFVSAFGLLLRVGGVMDGVRPVSRQEAEELVRAALVESEEDSRIEEVFGRVRASGPLGFPAFRQAVSDLVASGAVQPGGSAPDTAHQAPQLLVNAVTKDADQVGYKKVDLGAGDFLVPQHSTQTLRIVVDNELPGPA